MSIDKKNEVMGLVLLESSGFLSFYDFLVNHEGYYKATSTDNNGHTILSFLVNEPTTMHLAVYSVWGDLGRPAKTAFKVDVFIISVEISSITTNFSLTSDFESTNTLVTSTTDTLSKSSNNNAAILDVISILGIFVILIIKVKFGKIRKCD